MFQDVEHIDKIDQTNKYFVLSLHIPNDREHDSD